MVRTTVKVSGMACSMCEAHINDAIRAAFPVEKVSSSHSKGETVILSQAPLDENALRTAFSPAADPEPDTADAPNDITLLVRRFTLAFASKIYVQKRVQFERQITLQ